MFVFLFNTDAVLKLKYFITDTDSRHQDGVDVFVNISSRKLKLLFEMVPGIKTSNFVGEIFRAIEGNNKKIVLYVGLPKNSGNLTIKKFLTVTPSFHHLLQSCPFGHIHSNPSMFPMISCIPGSSQM